MHDIWNPWHGCTKISEGCENCYMYFLDRARKRDGSQIYRTQASFNYPISKDKNGNYKIQSGEMLRVCMTSDFFLEEADEWRREAWKIMKIRSDVKFFLLTKRPDRINLCLPENWGNGQENIFFNVSCENQKRADERISLLLKLPFKHKGVMLAPLIGKIDIEKYLSEGQIEQVICGGENYDGSRHCDFEWIKSLRKQCEKYNITFCFIETGTRFIKDGKVYNMPKKALQSEMALKSNMNFSGKSINFIAENEYGVVPKEELYVPKYRDNCAKCASKPICNGCSDCGKCG